MRMMAAAPGVVSPGSGASGKNDGGGGGGDGAAGRRRFECAQSESQHSARGGIEIVGDMTLRRCGRRLLRSSAVAPLSNAR